MDRFQYNFAEMFLWQSSTKIIQAILIRQKAWPPRAVLIFPKYLCRKFFKIFLSETTGPISILPGRKVSLITLYQDCSSRDDLSKTWPLVGGAYFPYISI